MLQFKQLYAPSSYDAARYARCVDACALGPDLEALPDGDRSEIGERGITLSGGQKARVSLARALYADADVYLLDDVLSAVDAHVGRHIVDRVLLDLLGDKTVVLASHQLACLDRATTVVVLKGGAVAFAGTPADCYAADALEGIRGESDDATGAASASREIAPTAPPAAKVVDEERKDDATADAGKLTTAEDRVVGTVSVRVLGSYARLCGTFFVFLVVAFLVLKTAGAVCAQAWVAEWTDATADEADDGADDGLNVRETRYYISGYAVVSFVTVAFVVANQLAAVNASAVASAEVHGLAFDAVVRAPLAYFEVTPPGRILARFGNDINVVDAMLMTSLNASGGQLAVLASVFVLCAILVPWLAPLTLPLFVSYWKMADLYRKSSRELKRLENMAETPVYSGFASCMDGLLTIRAFQGASERLVVQTDATIDDWATCWLKNNGANRWMGMRLDAIGAALVGLVALFCVLRVDGLLGMGSSFDAGRVGLMLSFAAAVSGILNWCVRGVAEAEQQLRPQRLDLLVLDARLLAVLVPVALRLLARRRHLLQALGQNVLDVEQVLDHQLREPEDLEERRVARPGLGQVAVGEHLQVALERLDVDVALDALEVHAVDDLEVDGLVALREVEAPRRQQRRRRILVALLRQRPGLVAVRRALAHDLGAERRDGHGGAGRRREAGCPTDGTAT
jgi:ABC-type multidrug transport system fused ATPase/permease subunit